MADEKKAENKTKKEMTARKRHIVIIALMVLVAFGAWHYARLTASYHGENDTWVKIPRGASESEAKDSIISALGDEFGQTVATLWNGDTNVSAGAYRIHSGEKAWRVAKRIGQGRQDPVKVTFNNVRTIDELAARLAARMDFSAEEFMKGVQTVASADSITPQSLAAQLLPDTYEAYWTDSPEKLLRKLQSHYRSVWNEERTAKAKALGLSPLQVSILASIVEEETNRRDERGTVARLYLNRLAKGMLLQADPTVKFAWGDFAAKRITADMLKVDSPYNTYRYAGLPPGIIRFPELRTIDDVLSAPAHNYIYMCARADLSGYHDFTSDYSRHLANAAAFRKAAYSSTSR